MTYTLHNADCLTALRAMPDESVHCCVTSPPYWGLRDYGIDGQLGLEKTPDEYVAKMVEVFREVRRVLRSDGTLWLNLGDSYSSGGRGSYDQALTSATSGKTNRSAAGLRHTPSWAKPKDLIGIPWRVAFALQTDGWYLRSDIIWHKPNPMPESVTDRPTKAHEYLFLLSKNAKYFYDAEAVKEDVLSPERFREKNNGESAVDTKMRGFDSHCGTYESGRNRRSVWTVATQPFSEAHFATFPPKLIEPCILAGCPEKVCAVCGASYQRMVKKEFVQSGPIRHRGAQKAGDLMAKSMTMGDKGRIGSWATETLGFQPSCSCNADTTAGITLDPFGGAGTTGLVALQLNREAVLIELNPTYCEMIQKRLDPLVNQGDLFRQAK